MNFSKINKTKTFKVNHPKFNKIKLQLLLVEVRVNFINGTDHVGGYDFWLSVGIDNGKFIKERLLNENIDEQTIDNIINFLSQHYKLDLSKHTLL